MTQGATFGRLVEEVWRFRYVIYAYVQTTLRLRYRRSYLGFLWTLLAPLAQYAVAGTMIWLLLRGRLVDNFSGHFLVGQIFFSLVAAVLGRGPNVLIQNEHFIKRIYLPKLIFVLNAVLYETSNFLLASSTLIVFGMAVGIIPVHTLAPLSLVGFLLTVLFLLGTTAILGVATVYVRDLANIVPVMLQALFFITPIAFSRAMVPERFRWAVDFNPLYYFLELVRAPLIQGVAPTLREYAIALALAIVTPLVGIVLLRKFDDDIVFRL
jgi:ABC-2 type transport system permease protein/lipopolysaccharide transport system permease protein